MIKSCHGTKQVHVDLKCLRFGVFFETQIFSDVVGKLVRRLRSSDLQIDITQLNRYNLREGDFYGIEQLARCRALGECC